MTKRIANTQRRSLVLDTSFRRCVHAESGRASMAKTCIHGYECWHCGFDQWLDEMETGQNARESFNMTRTVLAKAA